MEEGVREHGKPETINRDQDSQFASSDYIACIKSDETIKVSMDGIGRAKGNARPERFFRSYKWEPLCLAYPEAVPELKQMTKQYMHHYNWTRPHQTLGDKTGQDPISRSNGTGRTVVLSPYRNEA